MTNEMLGLPKSRFAAIGILEALGVASGMASAGANFLNRLLEFLICKFQMLNYKRAVQGFRFLNFECKLNEILECFVLMSFSSDLCIHLLFICFVIFTAMLPGPAIPILNQVCFPFFFPAIEYAVDTSTCLEM